MVKNNYCAINDSICVDFNILLTLTQMLYSFAKHVFCFPKENTDYVVDIFFLNIHTSVTIHSKTPQTTCCAMECNICVVFNFFMTSIQRPLSVVENVLQNVWP